MNAKDIIGRRFGSLVVTEAAPFRKGQRHKRVYALCDCGNTHDVRIAHLMDGGTQSCGCGRVADITGQRFGKLVAICVERDKKNANGVLRWLCKCDCGRFHVVSGDSLRLGRTKSCGGCTAGEGHYFWKSELTYQDRQDQKSYSEFRVWQDAVFLRDDFTCRKCGMKGGRLHAHHKEGYKDSVGDRVSLGNGVTFCKECHNDFHHQFGKGNNTTGQFDVFMNGGNEDEN